MSAILECIVNVSAGRDNELIHSLTAFLNSAPGVQLRHTDSGIDVNRTVFTFFVPASNFLEVGFQFIQMAQAGIDMRQQSGQHPRVGAVDVFPVVAWKNIEINEAISLTNQLAELVGEKLNTPIYLYEQSQSRSHRKRLEQIRRGGYEAMAERMLQADWQPDFGPNEFNAKTGVTVMGVRDILLAINFTIPNIDLAQGQSIAKHIRWSGYVQDGQRQRGKFKHVKAIAWMLPEYGHVQVSTNITKYRQSKLHEVFDEINLQAEQYGSEILSTELIGLIPKSALLMASQFYSNKDLTEIQAFQLAHDKFKFDFSIAELDNRLLDI